MVGIQDTLFMRFMVHFWIKYQKFRGASRICAIFLNFFLLLFKLVSCGIVMIICAPHLVANNLISRETMSIPQKMLYLLFVIVSIVVDLPLILATVIGVVSCAISIKNGMFAVAIPLGIISLIIGRFTIILLGSLFSKSVKEQVEDDEEECCEDEQYQDRTELDDIEEIPFCQLFKIGTEMCLLVDHIEMCPDETAFIRVVDDEGYTPLYKRKVKRDKRGCRYIVFNSTNHYLDDKKTQPVITKK